MFLLLLMGLGAAGVKAQVRIGGNGAPNAAAVLDLNANDDATPVANKGALALPRVSLASTTAQLNGATPVTGMLVYNTNASMTGGNGVGMYYWDGATWINVTTYEPPSPSNVKWIKSLDTTLIYANAPAATTMHLWSVPSALHTDFCAETGTAGWFIMALDGQIAISALNGSNSGQSVITLSAHVLCFRPVW